MGIWHSVLFRNQKNLICVSPHLVRRGVTKWAHLFTDLVQRGVTKWAPLFTELEISPQAPPLTAGLAKTVGRHPTPANCKPAWKSQAMLMRLARLSHPYGEPTLLHPSALGQVIHRSGSFRYERVHYARYNCPGFLFRFKRENSLWRA